MGSSWTTNGEELPFVGYAKNSDYAESGLLVDLYDASLDAADPATRAAAAIPVERIAGPVLLLAGAQDNLWPAARMAREVMSRLGRAEREYADELLVFDGAGHEVGGPGYGPASTARSMGGTPAGKARALAAGWAKTLGFLDRQVRARRSPVFAAQIDAWVEPLVEDRVLSGVLLVTHGDDVLYERAFGMADYEHGVPVTADTRFCIASISKPITQWLLQQLVDEGRLDPSDTIDRWLPDFPRGDEISVEMLRTHRSGIPHRVTTARDEIVPTSAAEMTARAAAAELLFEPGYRRALQQCGLQRARADSRARLGAALRPAAGAADLPAGGAREHGPRRWPRAAAESRAPVLSRRRRSRERASQGHVVPRRCRLDLVDGPRPRAPLSVARARQVAERASAKQYVPAREARWNGLTNGFGAFVQWLPKLGMRAIFTGNMASGRDALQAAVVAILRGEPPEPAPRLPRAVLVPWRTLRSYEGTYRVPGRFDLDVRLRGAVLRCEGRAMIPTGESLFYYPERDAHGAVHPRRSWPGDRDELAGTR